MASADEAVPDEARSARERQDYKAALKLLDSAIYPMRLAEDADGAEALAGEASRIAELTTGRTRKRALEVAEDANRAATLIRGSTYTEAARSAEAGATESIVQKDVSPVALAITLIGAAVMLIAVFLPRVESNTFFRVAQNTLIQSGGGWWFVVLAVAIAATAWFAYQRHAGGAGPMVLGLVAIGIAIYYGTNKGSLTLCPVNSNAANALGLGCSKASPGVGIYAAGVGGVLAALGGFQIWRSDAVAPEETENDAPSPKVEAIIPAGSDIEERLSKLEALHEKGLVTDAEYQQRRESILDQI